LRVPVGQDREEERRDENVMNQGWGRMVHPYFPTSHSSSFGPENG